MQGNASFFRRKLQHGTKLADRDTALIRLCREKAVVHVGCVDHPLAEEKLSSGDHLHAKLMEATSRIIGVDIDEVGIETLRERVGGEYLNIDLGKIDAAHAPDPCELFGFSPDIYIVSDVVEHLRDAVALLSGIASLERGSMATIVVTTPNSLAARNMINTALGYELMHPDHLLIHSPTTLKRTVQAAGLTVNSWGFYTVATGSDILHRIYDAPCKIASRIRPAWGDGIFVECASCYTATSTQFELE